MSEGGEQDKSELPTSYKLERARREGSVARGSDLGFVSMLAALSAALWLAGDRLVATVKHSTALGLSAADADLAGLAGLRALTDQLVHPVGAALLPVLGGIFAVVLAIEFIQTGPVFSTRAFRLDFNRLNPAAGLKRLFSVRLLIETAKGVLKLGLYGAIIGLLAMEAMRAAPLITDAGRLAATIGASGLKLIGFAAAAAAAIALLDQLTSRRQFLKKMRMSRREVKREHRDREGDPRLKQRRKELHGQFSRASQSLKGVRGADLMVVNPVHFAVALRYRPEIADAPIVVSRGSHAFALRLRRLAFAYGTPVIVDPPLARRLFRQSALNRPIPEDLFRPVADHYTALRRNQVRSSRADA